ncbi:hypothetical protein IQ270_14705 [Microcoleus sp. LEGE 07076]|nr:hypothetical protein [Microcoleus sp. LEGE 07076]MBE9185905.1 hypothetical protein [Microcoleus sp. LEGE 07076]
MLACDEQQKSIAIGVTIQTGMGNGELGIGPRRELVIGPRRELGIGNW